MASVVAIDAGTTGIRALAFDERATVLAGAHRALTQRFPRPGWVEHDATEIWALVRATLGETAARLADAGRTIDAVGLTNQRETAVAWDRRTGRPLGPAIVWQDRRTAARCEALVADGIEPEVRRRTGLVCDPYFTGTKFEWLLTEGDVPPGPALALGTVDAWVLWNLTGGAVHATDVTNASRTMLFDIGALAWTPAMCELLGVPIDALPEVRPSCGRVGAVTGGGHATRPGGGAPHPLLAGVPVSGVAGDQQAALFGQACFAPGMAKVTYGTGSFVLANAGATRPETIDGILTTVAWDLGAHAGTADRIAYALEGTTFVSGAAIQWLRDGLGLIDQAADIGPLAESVPDSAGLVAVPAFTGLGSPWWDARARGAVVGISRGTGRAQLARAVVEAMAYSVRDVVAAMAQATGAPCTELRADGGASAMDLLLSIQSEQLGIPVRRPRCLESTALGAAFLAGLAEGVWGSLGALEDLWVADVERRPVGEAADADRAHEAWLAAVGRARHWAAD